MLFLLLCSIHLLLIYTMQNRPKHAARVFTKPNLDTRLLCIYLHFNKTQDREYSNYLLSFYMMSNTKTISKNYTSLTTIASVCPTCSTDSTYSQETKVAVAEWHSDRKCITHQMQRNCLLLSL